MDRVTQFFVDMNIAALHRRCLRADPQPDPETVQRECLALREELERKFPHVPLRRTTI